MTTKNIKRICSECGRWYGCTSPNGHIVSACTKCSKKCYNQDVDKWPVHSEVMSLGLCVSCVFEFICPKGTVAYKLFVQKLYL